MTGMRWVKVWRVNEGEQQKEERVMGGEERGREKEEREKEREREREREGERRVTEQRGAESVCVGYCGVRVVQD